MKTLLTSLAMLLVLLAAAQDTTVPIAYKKRAVAAMEAQEQIQTNPIIIRNDSSKNWKKLITVQNRQQWTWWDYTKDFGRQMWKDKPYLVVLGAVFLLMGIGRLGKKRR